MRIAESRLRQIVLEEAELHLVKQVITEVVGEMQLNLTEEQRLLLEVSVLDAVKSAANKAAVPIAIMATLAFGSEIGANLQDLEGVGVTTSIAQQLHNGIETAKNMSDTRIDFLRKSIEDSSREGETPADLVKGKGLSPNDASEMAMDNLNTNYVQAGDVESTGKAQAGSGYLVYVPYDSLPDGYKDTFTGGAEKEDLKKFYQTMDIQALADKVKDFNSWGSQGAGNFYDTEAGQLLPSSWSIAFKALQDKHTDRAAKGKNLFKENA